MRPRTLRLRQAVALAGDDTPALNRGAGDALSPIGMIANESLGRNGLGVGPQVGRPNHDPLKVGGASRATYDPWAIPP